MRSTIYLLPLLSLISAAPLPSAHDKRLLGLGGSSGPLDILDPLTAPLDPVLDTVLDPVNDVLEPVTSLTGPISDLLDPVTDLVGDALDLLVPTLLVCANIGADVLGLVDANVCACVGLDNGGLWVDSDAGVDVNLPGLKTGLESQVCHEEHYDRIGRMRGFRGMADITDKVDRVGCRVPAPRTTDVQWEWRMDVPSSIQAS